MEHFNVEYVLTNVLADFIGISAVPERARVDNWCESVAEGSADRVKD